MGRVFMYGSIVLLAVFVVSSFTLLEHGNEGLGLVRIYTPHELPLGPAYEETDVQVNGTLVYNDSLGRYELTDDQTQQPVPLQGLDKQTLDPFVGEVVHVSGKYRATAGRDYYVEAKSIRLFEGATPTAINGPS